MVILLENLIHSTMDILLHFQKRWWYSPHSILRLLHIWERHDVGTWHAKQQLKGITLLLQLLFPIKTLIYTYLLDIVATVGHPSSKIYLAICRWIRNLCIIHFWQQRKIHPKFSISIQTYTNYWKLRLLKVLSCTKIFSLGCNNVGGLMMIDMTCRSNKCLIWKVLRAHRFISRKYT